MKKILVILGVLLFSTPIFAQTPVVTQPYNVTSYNASGSIGTTNTFQSIFAQNTTNRGRAGCTIQNNGTHNMLVFAGPLANATSTNSTTITPGQPYYCNIGGIVLQDQISITGTQNDTFFAAQQ